MHSATSLQIDVGKQKTIIHHPMRGLLFFFSFWTVFIKWCDNLRLRLSTTKTALSSWRITTTARYSAISFATQSARGDRSCPSVTRPGPYGSTLEQGSKSSATTAMPSLRCPYGQSILCAACHFGSATTVGGTLMHIRIYCPATHGLTTGKQREPVVVMLCIWYCIWQGFWLELTFPKRSSCFFRSLVKVFYTTK